MYYLSNYTNKLFTDTQIAVVNDIYGPNELNSCLEAATVIPVEAPNVIDLIKCNNMPGAAKRYQEIHNCKLKEAYDMVYRMRKDIFHTHRKDEKEDK